MILLLLLSSLASTVTEHRRGADEKHSEGNKNRNKPPREEEESPTPPWVHLVLHLSKACSIYTKNCLDAELQILREAPPKLGIWSCNNISHIQDYLFTDSKPHPGLICMNLGK